MVTLNFQSGFLSKELKKTGMFDDVGTFDWGKGNNSYLNKNDTLLTYWAGFNLTFQKEFVSFSNENNHKTDLKFCAPWLVHEENFEVHRFGSYTRKHL